MYAVLVINVEVPLEGLFHYHIPADLQAQLAIGHLVEVEFGRQMAQGIVVAFDSEAPVADTKPVISIIDPLPVVRPWQIALAQRMSGEYLTPLNQTLRLMLPPGLTRWADITVDINPRWDGTGRLTEVQARIIELLRAAGDMRGNKLRLALPKALRSQMRTAVNQMVKRNIVRRGSVLDPPRLRPKRIETAELILDPHKIRSEVVQLGRASKAADVLDYLALSRDPLPAEAAVLAATGAADKHLAQLEAEGLIQRVPAQTVTVETPTGDLATFEEAAALGLAIAPKQVLGHILRLRSAQSYYDVLHYLARMAQPVTLSEIYAATDATRSHLNRLVALDLVRYDSRQVWRDSLADRDFVPAEAPALTGDQARVWGRIKLAMLGVDVTDMDAEPDDDWDDADETAVDSDTDAAIDEGDDADDQPLSKPFLLHGVTGSGKTEIYMRAIEFALNRGQTAMVLVPEIALTPQTVRRFAARFPGRVAVLHSRLSDGERFDTWRRARLGRFDIAIGARSAMFAPLDNLGVIVLDEEHDGSYKQTPPVPPPYYHARDVAQWMGEITGATVILGSATPDLVTYHRARAGGLHLLTLPRRVMGHRQRVTEQATRLGRATAYQADDADPDDALTIPLPPVQIVDLRHELKVGNRSIFSRALQKGIDDVLARGEQAILFLNRRGTATYVFCRDCGHTLTCPNCDTPLTYHRPNADLQCHTCGYHQIQPSRCPACNSTRIRYFGLGTEQLEALVQERWPQARTVRWDRDTTAGRDSHEALLAQFVAHEADILIGTQMIAKGLDLPLVTLVGVVSADITLNLPDFRTGERAFQLLTQVAGRAGRGLLGGRVIVQTYRPEHYAIQAAAEHDYITFYLAEVRFRTQHGYPPFRRLVKLVLADPSQERGRTQAQQLAADLRARVRDLVLGATEIVGPTQPFFGRIDRQYRWQILIRSTDPLRLLADYRLPAGWVLDIDPESTL